MSKTMKRVIIESPLNAIDREGIERNKLYARRCMHDSLARNEAPFASHLLYDQEGMLDDTHPDHRRLGMSAGFAWGRVAELCAVYTDLGISNGMKLGIDLAIHNSVPVEYRKLDS